MIVAYCITAGLLLVALLAWIVVRSVAPPAEVLDELADLVESRATEDRPADELMVSDLRQLAADLRANRAVSTGAFLRWRAAMVKAYPSLIGAPRHQLRAHLALCELFGMLPRPQGHLRSVER